MDWGRTRIRRQIVDGLRELGVTDDNNRAINTFKNLHNYIKRTKPSSGRKMCLKCSMSVALRLQRTQLIWSMS